MSTKPTMVVLFNIKNSHILTLSLPTEEVFHVNGQNRPVTNIPVVDFHSRIVSNTHFFSVLAAIIRESSEDFAVHSSTDRIAPNASDLSAADWLYQHT